MWIVGGEETFNGLKEFLVDERPPDSVDVLQGTEPELLQYVDPVVLLQGEADERLLQLRDVRKVSVTTDLTLEIFSCLLTLIERGRGI